MIDPNIALQALNAAIDNTRMKVARGELVDITSMPEEIDRTCRIIVSLPPAQAKTFQSRLAGLVKKLDLLADELRQRRDMLTSSAPR